MGKTALDGAKRDTIFRIRYNDPAVKVEVIENPEHPQYDLRVLKPVNASLVWSMKHQGQINAATGYREGEADDGRTRVVLTSGIQRWKAQGALWEEERAAGIPEQDMSQFKLSIQKLSDERERIEVSLAENEQRVQDEPIERARKVRKYLDRVGEDEVTKARACTLFRIPSKDQLVNLLKLLELSPKAKEAVSAGQLTPTLGAQMSRYKPEEQDKMVERFAESPRPPSVREGIQTIREMSGKKTLQAATLREIDSEFETHEQRYEKAMDRLAELDKNLEKPDHAALREAATKVAQELGWIEALKWCRGETRKSKEEKDKAKAEGKKGKGKKGAAEAGTDGAA